VFAGLDGQSSGYTNSEVGGRKREGKGKRINLDSASKVKPGLNLVHTATTGESGKELRADLIVANMRRRFLGQRRKESGEI